MITEEIIKGNELIAVFMGFVRHFPNMIPTSDLSHVYYYPHTDRVFDEGLYTSTIKMTSQEGIYINQNITDSHHSKDMQFHKSWGWLMPVVEKIETISDAHHGRFGVHICSNNCTIQSTNFRSDQPSADPPYYFSDYILNSKIESVWVACVEFIRWYNEGNNYKP